MEKVFCHYKTIMLSVNLQAKEAAELQDRLTRVNADWSRACTGLQQWDHSLRKKLIRCQVRRHAKKKSICSKNQYYSERELILLVHHKISLPPVQIFMAV